MGSELRGCLCRPTPRKVSQFWTEHELAQLAMRREAHSKLTSAPGSSVISSSTACWVVPKALAGARARSVAAPIANREPQKSTAEGRKCGQLFSVEREGSR